MTQQQEREPRMTHEEVCAVITAMGVVDPRVDPVDTRIDPKTGPVDPRIPLFRRILAPYPYAQAVQAIDEYALTPHMTAMQIGDVAAGIRAIRARHHARVNVSELVLPDNGLHMDDGGREVTRSQLWARAAAEAIGDGVPPREAEAYADASLGITRLQVGPPAKRQLLDAPRGGTSAAPDIVTAPEGR